MTDQNHLNRRDFLKGATLTSLGIALAAEEINAHAQAAQPAGDTPAGPPVNCAVIGLGAQGREILATLAKLGNAPAVAICDSYTSPPYVKRASDIAPKAAFVAEYGKVLENPDVKAVFVATPSHLHKPIALDALAAGKHVYCEAPLASDLADARAIAVGAAASKALFQAGLQYRANKMHNHVRGFVLSGALGAPVGGRGQWHKKTSWRRGAPTPERQKDLNWRLFKETSLGLPGEVGIHQFDVASWFLKALPVKVSGFGGVQVWSSDGMEVQDTIQCVLEYPSGVRFVYDATLGNSFDGTYEMLMGANSAMLIRDQRAWMFKETDSPLLGWEVYARKDKVGDETGVALVADSTKLIAQGKEPGKVGADVTKTALYQAIDSFLDCVRTNKKPATGALEGYQATVVGARVQEACMGGTTVEFQKDWFAI
ncbi:MAG: Gfo/Idh/MocA family oxidoreductase [Chthonomonadales bacterium]|nr:Gfo/Idh/MocA family oxidoreductase [Chthonomonadales bacterium]